jgi:two-component system OmpR family sensor kinase
MVFQARDERLRLLRRLDHELKNPLTAMRAGLANLAEPASQAAHQEILDSIEAQVLRLSRLSVSLRKLADLEDRLVERSPVDVPALLQAAMDMAQDIPDAENRQLKLSLVHTPFPNVTGDADLLLLAIHNLLENAVKFTCQDDRIELRAFEEGASIIIQVADTGPGIPEEEQPHVWEELYRGKGGRGIPGSGLGLALVRTIMERHHGEATLYSQPGEGTIFSLRLPATRVTNR